VTERGRARQELLGPDLGARVRLELAEDGSGVGAAVIAAAAADATP
jgi:hexokinase